MTSAAENSIFYQWKLDAAEKQRNFYTYLGDRDWDEIPVEQLETIHDKISGSLYSTPYSKCQPEQQDTVSRTTNKVLELSGSRKCIHLGYVYVCFLTKQNHADGIYPLIRTENRYDEKIYFVESESCRVYTGWSDYEQNSTLPESWICSPVDGFYTQSEGKLALNFAESPACNRTLKLLDKVACVGSAVSTVVLGVSTVMFPPLMLVEGPAVAALLASGSYSVGRSVAQLRDRGSHHQSIALMDNGALPVWLNLIASIGSMTLGGVAAVSLGGSRLAAAILRYACIGVNSFGVILCVVNLVLKYRDGTVTWEDVDQFVFLAMFIANIVITRVIANRVVEAVAEEPHRLRNLFNVAKNTPHTAVKALLRDVPCALVMELLTGPMVVMILREINLPNLANTVSRMRPAVTNFIRGRISPIAFGSRVFSEMYPIFGKFKAEVIVSIEAMQKTLNVVYNYVVINGKSMFKNSSRIRVAQIMDCIREPVKNLNITDPNIEDKATEAMFKFSSNMAKSVDCQTDQEFAHLCEFLAEKVKKEYDNKFIVTAADVEHGMSAETKQTIFKDVITALETSSEKDKLVEQYRKMQWVIAETVTIFNQPVYQSPGTIMHYFETNSDFGDFNQFVYDAASELLCTDTLFENSTFDLQNSLFSILHEKKVLCFYFQPDRVERRVDGMAVLVDDL